MRLPCLSRSLLVTSLLCGAILPSARAHDVQIADDVGATLHIEPNDIARAGEPAELWFALTQAGGTVIPLENCDCTLTLYDSQAAVVATPTLTAVAAEGFQDIPGATVTFPEVGAYELVLTGSPQTSEDFSTFELRFEVTVASRGAGATPPPTTTEESLPPTAATVDSDNSATPDAATPDDTESAVAQASETPTPTSSSNLWIAAALLGGAVVIVGLAIAMMSGRRSPGDKE